jgi:hypothetical protein
LAEPAFDPSDPEKIVRINGHAFKLDPGLSSSVEAVVFVCRACEARSDTESIRRQCMGAHLTYHQGPGAVAVELEVHPNGRRKSYREHAHLRPQAIIELASFLSAPGVKQNHESGRDDYGHAVYHWKNPGSPYPCLSCPSPLGDEVRRLEKARIYAIDVEPAPAKLPAGPQQVTPLGDEPRAALVDPQAKRRVFFAALVIPVEAESPSQAAELAFQQARDVERVWTIYDADKGPDPLPPGQLGDFYGDGEPAEE